MTTLKQGNRIYTTGMKTADINALVAAGFVVVVVSSLRMAKLLGAL